MINYTGLPYFKKPFISRTVKVINDTWTHLGIPINMSMQCLYSSEYPLSETRFFRTLQNCPMDVS